MGFLKRDPSPSVAAYEELLARLPQSADDVLPQIPSAAAASGLTGRNLRNVNERAFTEYAEAALADGSLTMHEYVTFHGIATALSVEPSTDQTRLALIAAVNGGLLPAVQSQLITEPGEDAHFETRASLMKEVVQREFRAGYSGVSVRVAKGVRISGGGARGHSVVTGTKIAAEDDGVLVVTSQRSVFLGHRKTVEIPHQKLLNLTVFSDGIQFHVSGRTTAPLFSGLDGELAAAYVTQSAQRRTAHDATGPDDETVLRKIGDEFQRDVESHVAKGETFDFEGFVVAQAAQSGRSTDAIRTYLGELATRKAAELQQLEE